MVGDFNIHDLLWAGEMRRLPLAQHNSPWAEALKQLIEQRPLELVTPEGFVTWPTPIRARDPLGLPAPPSQNTPADAEAGPGTLSAEEKFTGSTINLIFVSWGLADHVRHVWEADLDGDSDHLPIETELDATLEPEPLRRHRNWAAMDTQKLATTLSAHLPPPLPADAAQRDIDQFVDRLVTALGTAIDAAVPWLRPSQHSHPGFTPECRVLLREKKRI